MTTRIQRWGNSMAVRLPKTLAHAAHLAEGTPVRLTLDGATLRIEAVPAPALDTLLDGITPDNLHGETHTGPPQGAEAW